MSAVAPRDLVCTLARRVFLVAEDHIIYERSIVGESALIFHACVHDSLCGLVASSITFTAGSVLIATIGKKSRTVCVNIYFE